MLTISASNAMEYQSEAEVRHDLWCDLGWGFSLLDFTRYLIGRYSF